MILTRSQKSCSPLRVGLPNHAANPLPLARYRETSAGAQPMTVVPFLPSNGAVA